MTWQAARRRAWWRRARTTWRCGFANGQSGTMYRWWQNPPLARTLYQSVAMGQEIPAHLYRAVAEVLAYIYRLLGGRLPS